MRLCKSSYKEKDAADVRQNESKKFLILLKFKTIVFFMSNTFSAAKLYSLIIFAVATAAKLNNFFRSKSR